MDAIIVLESLTSVNGPNGVVYSTNPERGSSADGVDYFVKKGDEVVFAEMTGCLLAAAVGLKVPPTRFCKFEDEVYCGSEKVADIGRNVAPWLRPEHCSNFRDLFAAIVVDVWLVNTDRNMGNVLARPGAAGMELVMIDFEKSKALKRHPIIETTITPPPSMWPTEELGRLARKYSPMTPPPAIVGSIVEFTRTPDRVAEIVLTVARHCPSVDWWDSTVDVVAKRGQNIARHAEEVWAI